MTIFKQTTSRPARESTSRIHRISRIAAVLRTAGAYHVSCSALFLLLALSTAFGQTKEELRRARDHMVDHEIVAAGVTNERVIRAMRTTPRHEFVSLNLRRRAYLDMALAIGHEQTISPPFVVAMMTEQIDPQPTDRVLEVGTGSGYQAAVLSPLVDSVYSIEIVEPLAHKAARTLKRLKYDNVHVKAGDGYQGWPDEAPFDKIIVTCSPEKVPSALVEQLKEGGRMVVPVGERYQQTLYLLTKRDGQMVQEALRPTLFVPMTGAAEQGRQAKPDPLRPTVVNGSFESLLEQTSPDEQPTPSGWHYQRQLRLIVDPKQACHGKHFVTFANDDPGRGCRALQGFAVDGRKIALLNVSLWVRGESIRAGQDRRQRPRLIVTFYDTRRAVVGEGMIGPWKGTFDWQQEQVRLRVPLTAREAILRIGLLGAVGQISFDDLRMQAATGN